MMENRSFDHFMGYLSLPPCSREDVYGLKSERDWLNRCANSHGGTDFLPFPLNDTDPYRVMDADPEHERGPISLQMGQAVDGVFPMNGYVDNYANSGGKCLSPDNQPPVMGYFQANHVPVMDFFAKKFTICDQWFSSLPAGTQPNRLMAMAGETYIDVNRLILPRQELIYDWLTEKGIPWRVYHEGVPFFALMPHWIDDILQNRNFRFLEHLSDDIDTRDDDGDEFPKVIFIEPTYTDAYHIGPSSDDHAPSAIKGGQQFLSTVYRLVRDTDLDFWEGVVMIVTYDEHGGFFDHFSPPAIRTDPPAGRSYPRFETLGVRVPAFIISPFVEQGGVSHEILDHTSILKFIGSKFNGGNYSPVVDARPVGNILDILKESTDETLNPPPLPSLHDYMNKEETPMVGYAPGARPSSPMQEGFKQSMGKMHQRDPGHKGKFGEYLDSFHSQEDEE